MNVDIHSHYFPNELLDFVQEHSNEMNAIVTSEGEVRRLTYRGGMSFLITPEFFDLDIRIRDMDLAGIGRSVLSIAPVVFSYEVNPQICLELCQFCNNWVAEFVKRQPDRFDCMAMVPMQDINLAMEEMRRAHQNLGINAVEIAPVINGAMLDNPQFFPFYQYCQEHGILIYLHPSQTDRRPPYDKYHAMNLIGYVQETNWALVRMIFGGVFQKFPKLKVLTSHGGGHFPYQLGRLVHGHQVRPEAKANISVSPAEYLKNIYYDTITHWTPALQFLVDNFGADHVLMGTDYPYDMADSTPVLSIEALRLTTEQRDKIRSGNYHSLIEERR